MMRNWLRWLSVVGGCALVMSSGYAASSYTPLGLRGNRGLQAAAPDSEAVAIDNGTVTIPMVIGSTSTLTWRIFLPPGIKTLQITEFLYASPPETQVVMRLGSPPASAAVDSSNMPDAADVLAILFDADNSDGSLELSFTSPAESGAIRLSDRPRGTTWPVVSQTGGWLYVRTLQAPGNKIFELNAMVEVDEACYRSWYANAKWDSSGHPVEDQVHNCDGSGGGTTVPALTGIRLDANSLTQGSGAVVKISPTPANAALGACTSSSSDITVTNGTVAFAATAAPLVYDVQAVIECGVYQATLTLRPASQSSTALTGITLSETTLDRSSSSTVTISPTPSNAALPSCSAAYSNGVSDLVQISGAHVTLTASAASLTQTATVTIRCAGASATLTITAPGGTGTGVGGSLTGIRLSSQSMVLGEGHTVTISPVPAGVQLPVCEAKSLWGNSSLVTVTGDRIEDGISASLLSSQDSVDIVCGSVQARLDVWPKGTNPGGSSGTGTSVAGIVTTESTVNGNLVLTAKVTPSSSEKGKRTRWWVVAKVPGQKIGAARDFFFFNTNPTWKVLVGLDLDTLKFTEVSSFPNEQTLSIATGLTKADLNAFEVEIGLTYQIEDEVARQYPLWHWK